ncbi:MAG: hypothetical protein AB8B89_06030 [Gammaproteobacteria bacterium]
MRIFSLGIILLLVFILSACLPTGDKQPEPLSKQQMSNILDEALANPKGFQNSLKESCSKFSPLLLEVAETINMGSRIWNAGGLPITIRLYEGVAYRVLYEAGDHCPDLSHAFQAGLMRADERETANGKGRVLRQTLDLIMGGLPAKPPGAQ